MTDTIFALSSGHGKAGVAVIRISGTGLREFFSKIIQSGDIIPRRAYLINLRDNGGGPIDQCIAIYFQAPSSFTGEDVIELHTHGSYAVIEKVYEFLRGQGFRLAEPGEFTRRAFQNNKMDLVAADGLAGLLSARTDKQRAAALKSMTGSDSAAYENWRAQMIEIAAYAAAILDYPKDELPENIKDKLLARASALHTEISGAISRYAAARAVRSGFNIVLAGETNAGKSSLFNRLVGESRAIVSDIPGTTRDAISAELDIDGYLVRLTDTAGLRETDDVIEKIGIEKTNAEIKNADLVIKVMDKRTKGQKDNTNNNEIIVYNKSDLSDTSAHLSICPFVLSVSALTGAGIPELLELIKQKIHNALDGAESDINVNQRARAHLIAAAEELEMAGKQSANMDLFAEHIRIASDEIGQILGVIEASEIADAVFGQLCLGK
ncbi:MAG: tRNA uridine-5-carboxymethylaminomethyl(34) synthesis GTPase MnmE [Rickettsiales bacterium]|jgi:tRNA modification GTPase|nr:tRNA uridine-5-carboxymethylaminomethyl(34) synthesis GTPase MnmE [Rickettsiales bacterium]